MKNCFARSKKNMIQLAKKGGIKKVVKKIIKKGRKKPASHVWKLNDTTKHKSYNDQFDV